MGMFFTIIVVELTDAFPPVLVSALTAANATSLIADMSAIPPTGALFAAFLGYNPVEMIIDGLSPATIATLTNTVWFPTTLAEAFMPSLGLSFYIGAGLSFVAAILCAMRGNKYIEELDNAPGKN